MFKNLVILVIIVFTLSSCSTIGGLIIKPNLPDACSGATNSLILNTISNPGIVDNIAGIVLSKALDRIKDCENKNHYIDVTVKVIDKTQGYLNDPKFTYSSFIQYLCTNIKWINDYIGDGVIYLTDYINALNKEIPITKCDREIFDNSLENIKKVLKKKRR